MSQTKEDFSIASKKYFIFKFFEYTQGNYRLIQNKRSDSIVLILRECLEVFNEYYESKNQHLKDVLKVSLDRMLDIIVHHTQYNPLIQYSSLNNDFRFLASQLEKEDKRGKNESVFYSVMALNKRIESMDLIRLHIDIIKNQILTYTETDRLLDSFVNELIHKGYSLRYLKEWYRMKIFNSSKTDEVNNNNLAAIHELLDVFRELENLENRYTVVFSVNLPQYISGNITFEQPLNVGNNFIFQVCTQEDIALFKQYGVHEKMPKDEKRFVLLKTTQSPSESFSS